MTKWAVRAVFAGICGLWTSSIFWLYLRTATSVTWKLNLLHTVDTVDLLSSPFSVSMSGVIRWIKRLGRGLMSEMARRDRWYWRLLSDVSCRGRNRVAALPRKNFW